MTTPIDASDNGLADEDSRQQGASGMRTSPPVPITRVTYEVQVSILSIH